MFGWLRRHRRKFAYGSAVLGGLYVAGRLAASHYARVRAREEAALLERVRKQNHWGATESTIAHTLASVYREMQGVMEKEFPAQQVLGKLREKPGAEEKLRLWTELKVISFSRCLSSLLSSVLLSLLVRTQLCLLAGQLYQGSQLSTALQEAFLRACDTLNSRGVPQICRFVRDLLEPQLSSLQLDEKLSLVEVENLLFKSFDLVREAEGDASGNPLRKPGTFFLPQDEDPGFKAASEEERILLKQMFCDTLDVLESEDTLNLMVQMCRQGLTHMLDKIALYYVAVGKGSREPSPASSHKHPPVLHETPPSISERRPHAATTSQRQPDLATTSEPELCPDSGFVSPANVSVHLAKLLPLITAQTRIASEGEPDAWLEHLQEHPDSKLLGANVYEAFSAPKTIAQEQEGWNTYLNKLSSYF